MALNPFTLAVGDYTLSAPEGQVIDFEEWTLTNNLDEGCDIQFTARGNSTTALLIDELVTDVWLYRGSALYQRFRIISVEQEWGPDGSDDIRITGACYRRLLRKAHVRSLQTYTGISQGDIVWNLIQHAQAANGGNLGITLGTSGPAILRDREYIVGQNIYDAITELTKIDNGISWDINENLELLVGDQFTFPIRATPIELGSTARRLLRPSSAERFANAAIVTGNTLATTTEIVETTGILSDPRGRWEKYLSLGQIDQQAALQDAADGLIDESISPITTWQIEMEPTRYFYDAEYEIGDFVNLVVPRSTVFSIGQPGVLVTVQIISRTITQTASGDVTVNLTAIEIPGS
jgi:hypothetical protein